MKKSNVRELIQPGEFKDHLTEVLRQGAADEEPSPPPKVPKRSKEY